MKQEDRDLYLKNLCERLPYHPKAEITFGRIKEIKTFESKHLFSPPYTSRKPKTYEVKLFLRSMSSMTKEETAEYKHLINKYAASNPDSAISMIAWLNSHHFDYCGLIEKGLALEAPKGMYK